MQAPAANATIMVLVFFFFLVLKDKVDTFYLSLAAASLLLFSGLRMIIWYFHRTAEKKYTTEQWLAIYTVVTGLLGLVFGLFYLFGYQNQDLIVSFVLSLVLFAVISAAGYVLYCHLPIFIVYTYPQALIFAGVQVSNPTTAEKIIALAVITYLAMLTVITRNANKQFKQSIRLQCANKNLIDELNQEVAQREHLIEKRTNELVRSNTVLEKEIHDRKQAEEDAGFQVTMLNSVLNSTPDLIYYKDYTDMDGVYIGCNDAYSKLCGRSRDEIMGLDDIELFGAEEGAYLRAKDQVALQANSTHLYEEWVTYPDGRKVLLSALKTPFYDHKQSLIGILGVGRDITELKHTEEQLKRNELSLHHLAHHDTLTDLPNRLLLIDRLNQSIKKAWRANKGLAVMFIDLDYFKEINDSLDHSIGDQLLQAVAQRLKNTIRKEDTAARLGGDEFTIILEQLENINYVSKLADKLLSAFKKPLKLRHREITITISIGISLFPEHGTDTETLLRNADSAMYQTKNEGRNGYSLYTEELTQRAVERLALESSLRKAVVNDELILHYQPQVELSSRKIVGVEALLRWLHPQEGLLYPERFISLAEEIGLVDEIGLWAIGETCRRSVEWIEAGYEPLRIAVNISGGQLLDENFVQKIRQIIDDSGCRPDLIELEITERNLIQYPEKTVVQFNELRDIGIQITIDDFGTGYSSLTYLKEFPISKLKIDDSFVRDILDDPDDQAITRAIIALGKSLDIKVIAEGVENGEQQKFLQAEGCEEAQGFYFAKPMPEGKLLKFLQRQ